MKTFFKILIFIAIAGFSVSSPAIERGDLRQCVTLNELRDSAVEFRLLTSEQNRCINHMNKVLARSSSLKGVPSNILELSTMCYRLDFYDEDERISFSLTTQNETAAVYEVGEFCDLAYARKGFVNKRERLLRAFDRDVKAKVVGDIEVDKEVDAIFRYFEKKDAETRFADLE